MNNKSRKTSHISNIIQFDAEGHVVLPATLTLGTEPHSSDNTTKVPSTAWVRAFVGNLGYQSALSLTTSGSSGAASLVGSTLNIPTYTLSGLGGVPTSRSLTINGVAYDLSADRSWTINSMVYPGAGIAVSTGTAWGTSITDNSANWNTAYGWGNHALAGYELASNKGVAGGYASLDVTGKIPSTQLPSYVDDVVEYSNTGSFPGIGDTGKIYIALDTNKTYRWGGSSYTEISPSPGSTDAVPEGSTNLYFTSARARGSISVSGSLSYNVSTGVISYSQPSNISAFNNDSGYVTSAGARGSISVSGSLSYNSSTGVISYSQPSNVSAFNNDAGYLVSSTAAATYVSLSGSYANPSWITSFAWSKITGAPAFLTSYTETDTLATVTGRGASTSTALTFNGAISIPSSTLSFGAATRQMINLWNSNYGIGVQSSTTYFRSDSRFSWHRGGSHNDNENNPGGGTVAMTLDGSSNLAVTGSITAGGNTVWNAGNDGSGSGLDADLLDGLHQSEFLRVSSSSSSPLNGTFAIGSASGRNFIQSHSGQPLDINPLGNAVTINGNTPLTSGNYTSYSPSLTGSGASGTWGIRITGFANQGTARLYSTDSAYNYDAANPYFGYLTYDGSRWLFQVSPGTPAAVRVAYADSAGSASSASTASQVTINYNNDSNSTYQILWGSGNSVYGTGGVYVNPSSDTIYAAAYRGNANVSGTGEATYHPAGIYSTGTNWLYGTMYLNVNSINDTGDIRTYNSGYSFRARYTAGSDIYHGSLNWYGLQLGNNGDNYIIGGRTNTGGNLTFYVNNTSDFTSINGVFAAKMHSTGRTSFGQNSDNGYQVQVYGSLYASDWIRVGGSQGLYFESYGGGWRMTDSSYIRSYNAKALSMEGASVDYVGSIYMNGGVYIQTQNNRNLQVTSSGAGDNGIYGRGNSGQFCYQLYGNGSGSYGFLDGVWAAWDLRKAVDGALYMNDNDSYYLQTNSLSRLYSGQFDYIGVGQAINTNYRIITSGDYYANAGGNFWAEGRFKQYRGSGTWHDVIDSGNIGSQSVNYANSAGSTSYFNTTFGADIESVTSGGIYRQETPSSGLNYTTTLNMNSSDGRQQLSISRGGDVMKFRGTTTGSGTSWNPWKTVIDSSNIGSQSVSYASSAGNADTVDGLHASSFVRNDTSGQYLRAYYQYGSYLTTETPLDLVNQGLSGGGLRVDFMYPSYTGSGNWNHVITWSGYNGYNMYQLGGNYDGGTGTDLWVRSEANHGRTSWTSWRRLLNTSSDPYAANMNQYVRTSDGPTFTNIYNNGWFRNNNVNEGVYNQATGTHFYSSNGTGFTVTGSGGTVELVFRSNHQSTVRGYVYGDTSSNFGLLDNSGNWQVRLNPNNNGGQLYGNWLFSGAIRRNSHSSGFLEGSYNNIGANDTKSNPIYTIGSSYNPSDSSLGNMYGIGYSHPNFWGSGKVAGWGLYVANNGTIDACIGGDSTSSVGIWSRLDIVAYSDARVKDNVQVVENALEKLQAIRGVTFTRNDIDDKEKRHAGVIAQEVLAVMPELVTGDEESRYSVAYGNMAALFIEAIKEQQQQIEELKTKLDGLTK